MDPYNLRQQEPVSPLDWDLMSTFLDEEAWNNTPLNQTKDNNAPSETRLVVQTAFQPLASSEEPFISKADVPGPKTFPRNLNHAAHHNPYLSGSLDSNATTNEFSSFLNSTSLFGGNLASPNQVDMSLAKSETFLQTRMQAENTAKKHTSSLQWPTAQPSTLPLTVTLQNGDTPFAQNGANYNNFNKQQSIIKPSWPSDIRHHSRKPSVVPHNTQTQQSTSKRVKNTSVQKASALGLSRPVRLSNGHSHNTTLHEQWSTGDVASKKDSRSQTSEIIDLTMEDSTPIPTPKPEIPTVVTGKVKNNPRLKTPILPITTLLDKVKKVSEEPEPAWKKPNNDVVPAEDDDSDDSSDSSDEEAVEGENQFWKYKVFRQETDSLGHTGDPVLLRVHFKRERAESHVLKEILNARYNLPECSRLEVRAIFEDNSLVGQVLEFNYGRKVYVFIEKLLMKYDEKPWGKLSVLPTRVYSIVESMIYYKPSAEDKTTKEDPPITHYTSTASDETFVIRQQANEEANRRLLAHRTSHLGKQLWDRYVPKDMHMMARKYLLDLEEAEGLFDWTTRLAPDSEGRTRRVTVRVKEQLVKGPRN
ncbi:hypothetical protein AJ80_09004 [Polytolypa hystricis UAMH7299]|uniref:Uncharacterized protein n=1 Tax=Polytolypa hystricis (strain UAMH7299) TaxID=1447883 RepID=A0A2B7WPV8_POLH7|nr:hypothetical protein AJ80_09004 [Polytolypa hystricis UAMH7299]